MATEIKVPTLGESVTEATVAKWLKKVGDNVAVDEPLVEMETDKVTLEVNAAAAGVLQGRAPGQGRRARPYRRRRCRYRSGGPRAAAGADSRTRSGAAGRAASRGGGARAARPHDPLAPAHRRAAEAGAEHRRDAD